MKLLPLFIIVFLLSFSVRGENVISLPIGDFNKLNVPDSVLIENPITWTVHLTNALTRPIRVHVATTADALSYRGDFQARLYLNIVTNNLAAGESKVLTFSTGLNWQPTNTTYDCVEINAAVVDLDKLGIGDYGFDLNYHRVLVHSETESEEDRQMKEELQRAVE